MTYKNQFVADVKLNGKILRIKDESVYLPFGSEYSLLLKNLNSQRASVNITIDGEDVLDGYSLILEPNATTELEGFLRGTTAKNRFKFIQKTKKIQEHRGDRADDGLIRIEFAYEKPQPEPLIKKTIKEIHEHHYHYHQPWRYTIYDSGYDWHFCDNFTSDGSNGDTVRGINNFYSSMSNTMGVSNEGNVTANYSSVVDNQAGTPLDDEGITVKGSEISQQFRYSCIGALEPSQVIVIRLKGTTNTNTVVEKPVTIQTKLVCPTCGTKSKSSCKFCPECGTYLE